MTRLKRYLKNLVKPALLFSAISFLLILGCFDSNIQPTYKEEDIPYLVKKICKDEYSLDVTATRTPTTLWIYAPLDKLLHKDYGVKEDKFFDDEITEKLRNIITTTGRVLISSDNAPEFYAILASDIQSGIDYTMIGNVMDIKKSYAGTIPMMEANRRYVVDFKAAPEAIGDLTGNHLKGRNITLPVFLAEQIAQRISFRFQDEWLKDYFKVESSTGKFGKYTFKIEYEITQIKKPPKKIIIKNEVLDIIAYCLKTYDFKDFSMVEVTDLATKERSDLSKAVILARPIN
ncbi:MAG: hypothetical protein PHO70_08240 [Candidatus Omnitrophica bacterium]|nr:hypothetical protein [Candidatus Omnitrophota bacterium]